MDLPFARRIVPIHRSGRTGSFVLYWMQGAFRTVDNHALEFAKWLARERGLPLVVLIVVDFGYRGANYRHFRFFVDGIRRLAPRLSALGISCHVRVGPFREVVGTYAARAAALVTERAYLAWLARIRREICAAADVTAWEVDTNVVVPVHLASDRREVAARTLRPKIRRLAPAFLDDPGPVDPPPGGGELVDELAGLDDAELRRRTAPLPPVAFVGGEEAAHEALDRFLAGPFHAFADRRGDPAVACESDLSPWLHFGFVSPLTVLRRAAAVEADPRHYEALFEQLVVRRELAHNFTVHTPDLDDPAGFLPEWALRTLRAHAGDPRPQVYDLDTLERARTHDPWWNAAQTELVRRGKIHNYMRMYWGKKVLEWSPTFEEAYCRLVHLNDRWALDGRDPNGYAGIGWCFGLHDRPFVERPVFGKVRWMSAAGLERKFDMARYVERVARLPDPFGPPPPSPPAPGD